MAIKPKRVEYDLGRTRHNQPLKLVWEGDAWHLIKEPVNQRDQVDRIELTPDQIAEIAAIEAERRS